MPIQFTLAGAGCCLVDRIYADIRFGSPETAAYLSRTEQDGGLHPGKLVFSEAFAAYCGQDLRTAMETINAGGPAPVMNVGGPSIVSLIHAAQLLADTGANVVFYGTRGDDRAGEFLLDRLKKTPVNLAHLRTTGRSTPSTLVLSDPSYNRGHGERAFINDIGAAWDMGPEDLGKGFFDADMVVFGGTALVPGLHDSLSRLLKKAKELGRITVVNTVYDFRNEMAQPGERWPLGDSDTSYAHTDLLICDLEEARRLSGKEDLHEAGVFFREQGLSAFLITCGTDPGLAWSGGSIFESMGMKAFPVSSALVRDLAGYKGGDTTGCGDNFAGGVLASLARQLMEGNKPVNLDECIAWGTVSGGFCCFYTGGSYPESAQGEKAARILPYYEQYKAQIHD